MILNFWIWLLNFCKTFVVEFRIILISESESSVSIGFGIISYPSVANIYWNVHQLSIFRPEQFLLAFLVGGKIKKIWFFWLSTPAGRVWKPDIKCYCPLTCIHFPISVMKVSNMSISKLSQKDHLRYLSEKYMERTAWRQLKMLNIMWW